MDGERLCSSKNSLENAPRCASSIIGEFLPVVIWRVLFVQSSAAARQRRDIHTADGGLAQRGRGRTQLVPDAARQLVDDRRRSVPLVGVDCRRRRRQEIGRSHSDVSAANLRR